MVMFEESAFSHSVAINPGKGMIASRWLTDRSLLLLPGVECFEASQRLSSLVDIGNSPTISHHSSSVEHQNHLRSAAGSEEKSSAHVRNLDARGIQQRKCGTFTNFVCSRLVSRHYPRTTEIHSSST